jgi:hypothetical protein
MVIVFFFDQFTYVEGIGLLQALCLLMKLFKFKNLDAGLATKRKYLLLFATILLAFLLVLK